MAHSHQGLLTFVPSLEAALCAQLIGHRVEIPTFGAAASDAAIHIEPALIDTAADIQFLGIEAAPGHCQL